MKMLNRTVLFLTCIASLSHSSLFSQPKAPISLMQQAYYQLLAIENVIGVHSLPHATVIAVLLYQAAQQHKPDTLIAIDKYGDAHDVSMSRSHLVGQALKLGVISKLIFSGVSHLTSSIFQQAYYKFSKEQLYELSRIAKDALDDACKSCSEEQKQFLLHTMPASTLAKMYAFFIRGCLLLGISSPKTVLSYSLALAGIYHIRIYSSLKQRFLISTLTAFISYYTTTTCLSCLERLSKYFDPVSLPIEQARLALEQAREYMAILNS